MLTEDVRIAQQGIVETTATCSASVVELLVSQRQRPRQGLVYPLV